MNVEEMIAEYEDTIERLQGLLAEKEQKRLLYHKEILLLIEEIGDVRFALRMLRGYSPRYRDGKGGDSDDHSHGSRYGKDL